MRKTRRYPPSRRDVAIGNRRTGAITEALADASGERRGALLRAADKQNIVLRDPKKTPPGHQLPLLDGA